MKKEKNEYELQREASKWLKDNTRLVRREYEAFSCDCDGDLLTESLERFAVSFFLTDPSSGCIRGCKYCGHDLDNNYNHRTTTTYVFLGKGNLPVRVEYEVGENVWLTIAYSGELPTSLEKILVAYQFEEVKEEEA